MTAMIISVHHPLPCHAGAAASCSSSQCDQGRTANSMDGISSGGGRQPPAPGGDMGALLHDATVEPATANPAAPACPAAAALAQHMDSEDRRVKDLTEGILYELLPSALQVMLPACEDPLRELDAERCRVSATVHALQGGTSHVRRREGTCVGSIQQWAGRGARLHVLALTTTCCLGAGACRLLLALRWLLPA